MYFDACVHRTGRDENNKPRQSRPWVMAKDKTVNTQSARFLPGSVLLELSLAGLVGCQDVDQGFSWAPPAPTLQRSVWPAATRLSKMYSVGMSWPKTGCFCATGVCPCVHVLVGIMTPLHSLLT